MKILASDFDGTFNTGGDSVYRNIEAVLRWQKAGNQFGIVTGRPYHLFLPELKQYQIPVDFLVCVNGAAIHEPDGKLLWSAALPDDNGGGDGVNPLSMLESIVGWWYLLAMPAIALICWLPMYLIPLKCGKGD